MMALRHLAARLDYEAVIESHLTEGKEPPSDLRPPVLRPSDPEAHKEWVKIGWKAAQTRSIAIDDARKGKRPPPLDPRKDPPPQSAQYRRAHPGLPATGFPAKPALTRQNSDPNSLARAATTRTGY
jgi:hypothetical protein